MIDMMAMKLECDRNNNTCSSLCTYYNYCRLNNIGSIAYADGENTGGTTIAETVSEDPITKQINSVISSINKEISEKGRQLDHERLLSLAKANIKLNGVLHELHNH